MISQYSKNNYIIDLNNTVKPGEKNINFPVNFDTEFQVPYDSHRIDDQKIFVEGRELIWPVTNRARLPITCQISTLDDNNKKIYIYPEFNKFNQLNQIGDIRHETLEDDSFIPLEFFKSINQNFNYLLSNQPEKYGNNFTVTIYGFFLTAEIGLLCTGKCKTEIKRIINHKDLKATKRLTTGNLFCDYIKTKFVAIWKGYKYNVNLRLVDLAAIHGPAGYGDIAKNVGHELKYKDNLTTEDKEKMVITYFNKPELYDEYSLGDLDCYQILVKNSELKKQIYRELDIEDYYNQPKLTIGSEVSNLLESVVMRQFDISPLNYKDKPVYKFVLSLIDNKEKLTFKGFKNEFFRIFGETNTALLSNRLDSGNLLAKVFGGRCYNNRNSERYVKNLMIDLDIAGCYGNGLLNQDYPFGYPKFITKPLNKTVTELTLKQFLKDNEGELLPGLWSAVISTKSDLIYNQDFFPSWIDWKIENHEINVKSGITKLFQKRIVNGVLTSDGLDFIYYVMSQKQREDFLKKVVIDSVVYYPKSTRLNSLDELLNKPYGENYWFAINMGDLVIKELLSKRKKYPKGSSLNTMFKLMINTTYGDIVSPYFNISNGLVGNNITARARALCYYMEKGLNGFQSITDGVCFEVEKVLFPTRTKYHNAVELTTMKNVKYGVLFNSKELTDKYLYLKNNPDLKDEKNSFDNYINTTCFKHLKEVFNPEIAIFKYNQFQFEYKEIIAEATFMGSSDYCFTYLDGTIKFKKRSYNEKRMRFEVKKVNNGWFEIDEYPLGNVPKKIMSDLKNSQLQINPPGLQYQILKVNEYKKNKDKYDGLGLLPGDNITKIVIPKNISISQVKYNNPDEYEQLKKFNDKLIRKNNIGIGELFYVNNKVKFTPEFFNNPFKYTALYKEKNNLNPYSQLIKNIRKMMDGLIVSEHFENENLESFDLFEDDESYESDENYWSEDEYVDMEIDF
jgi:hypothetical protein